MSQEYMTGTSRGDKLYKLVGKTESGIVTLAKDAIKYGLGRVGADQYFKTREADVVSRMAGLEELHGLISERIKQAADMVKIEKLRRMLDQGNADFSKEWNEFSRIHFSDTKAMRWLQFGFTLPLIFSRIFGKPALRNKAEEYRQNGQKKMAWLTHDGTKPATDKDRYQHVEFSKIDMALAA